MSARRCPCYLHDRGPMEPVGCICECDHDAEQHRFLRHSLAALCAEREAKDGLIPARRVRALIGSAK